MLWANPRIIQARRDGVGLLDLTIRRLQEIGTRSMQHTSQRSQGNGAPRHQQCPSSGSHCACPSRCHPWIHPFLLCKERPGTGSQGPCSPPASTPMILTSRSHPNVNLDGKKCLLRPLRPGTEVSCQRASLSSKKALNIPIAFEPPPTHATTKSYRVRPIKELDLRKGVTGKGIWPFFYRQISEMLTCNMPHAIQTNSPLKETCPRQCYKRLPHLARSTHGIEARALKNNTSGGLHCIHVH